MVSRIAAALRAEVADIFRVLITPLPPRVEIPPNVQRIERIPYALLPDASPARDALITLAWRGCDVDAYQPHMSSEWVIWCRPSKDAPNQDGRYSIEQWKAICDSEVSRLLPDLWKEEQPPCSASLT